MNEAPLSLIALSEAQRAQAQERYLIIRPALEKEVSQAQVARTHQLAPSTIQLWIKQYREKGLAGLANHTARSDKGKSRSFPEQAIRLIEGLALQTPPRSVAAIHRQVTAIAKEQGWKPLSYERVRQLIKQLDPALVTLAHQGAAAYREEFDLLYRREATHSNAMWQADHSPLDIWLLDESGKPAKPWLTVIEDDYSRAIASFRLTFQEPTPLTTALALRQAIWRKDDPRWQICGIPSVFYTDHGSDFTSKHIEQVAIDVGIELIFSEKGVPRGRGKIERFLRSVNVLFLQDLLGYCPAGYKGTQASRGKDDFLLAYRLPKRTELVIVDEAQRLKPAALEQLRDFYDRGHFGLVVIGQPGLEKTLARYPQLYSRVGFAHQFRVLSEAEIKWLLQERWSHLGMHIRVDDFTDAEALAAIVRITGVNFRVIHRLLMQIERILEINHLQTVTKEVVEKARERLVLG